MANLWGCQSGIRLLGITVSDLSQLAFENIRLNLYEHQAKEVETLAYKSNTLLSENEDINENKNIREDSTIEPAPDQASSELEDGDA